MATSTVDQFVRSASGKNTIPKAPGAVTLDYTFRWDKWLDAVGDTIVSVTASIEGGSATVVRSEILSGAKRARVWVTGGVKGEESKLFCQITTSSQPTARVDTRFVVLEIKDRS